ncbi:MAG: CarD family transcriptional regulator [Pseudomonadota bacterium]
MATRKTTKKKAPAKKAAAAPKKAAAKKTVAKKTIAKKAPAKKAATKKVTAKKPAQKAAVKKTPAKKAPAKKTSVKKVVAKPVSKAADTKKTTSASNAASTKAATKKVAAKTTMKQTSTKKTATKKLAAKTAAAKTTSKKASTKKAVNATATPDPVSTDTVAPDDSASTASKPAKKTTTKAAKKTTRKKAVKEPAPKPVVVGKVGQAPRRTANEVAASNPFPVPPKLHEVQEEQNDTPSPESKAAKKDFKVNDKIVYPAHGVGIIEAIERQDIVGITIEVFVIRFDHEKLTLRVPTEKAKAVGMRGLSDVPFVDKTIEVLQGRARIKRTMWSRRAQEYEAKINSGNLQSVAEVVRDLYRAPEQPEQSYSERQLFEAALDRMAREVAAVKKINLEAAIGELEASLHKKQIAAA